MSCTIGKSVSHQARKIGFPIPEAAYVIALTKLERMEKKEERTEGAAHETLVPDFIRLDHGIGGQGGCTHHQELMRRTQELYDAVATGNPTPWKQYFADDCIFSDEKGRTMDKSSLWPILLHCRLGLWYD